MEELTFTEIVEFITNPLNIRMLICGVVLIASYIFLGIWEASRKPLPSKAVEKAKKRGNTAVATLVKQWSDDPLSRYAGNGYYYHAVYTFTVDGKEYEYRFLQKDEVPPAKVTVYWKNTPKRAFRERDKINPVEKAIGCGAYIVPLALAVGLFFLIGGGKYI